MEGEAEGEVEGEGVMRGRLGWAGGVDRGRICSGGGDWRRV